MRLRLWGVRGSAPWASAPCIGYGCNTPCVELVSDGGNRLILDAGSGLVGLGDVLSRERGPATILLTHYHWDHLQGLPSFAPLYLPDSSPTIWAPDINDLDGGWLETMFTSPFFPMPYASLRSRPTIERIVVGSHLISGFRVRALPLNHPGGAFAYRIQGRNGDVVYATDHELGQPAFDEPLADFVRGAKLLIFDSHFTPEEGPAYKNWGHSHWAEVAVFAASTAVDRLWLFHHKPGRTDIELTEIEAAARKIHAHTDAAGEGDTFEL
jgi:phosphoribosyl 1,2-cyclic phosphodiesterase